MARVLICGTLAYDDIGAFGAPLAPGTRNVKLTRLHQGFGGCAMNVAYNLAGLGHRAVPFVYAGDDYSGDYARHVAAAGISEAGIFRIPGTRSARGIVLTGSDGAQFTAFYPGPSGIERWEHDLDSLLDEGSFDAVVLAPDLPEKTAGCAARVAGVPLTIWCPGQYAEMLTRADIEPVLAQADMLVANRLEWHSLVDQMGEDALLAAGLRVVITDGGGPVEILPGGERVPVPPVADADIVDPTGCGDAFVAALTSALLAGAPPATAVAAGARLAGACLRCPGAQAHPVNGDAGKSGAA